MSHDFDAPGSASRRLVRSVIVGSIFCLFAVLITVGLRERAWQQLPGFIWAQSITYICAGFVMTPLLAYQAHSGSSRTMSVLAGATLFAALMFITFFVSFPDTLSSGVWIGGSQSAVWTYELEHIGFIAGLAAAAVLGLLQPRLGPASPRWTPWSLIIATAVAALASLLVLAGADSLPLLIDATKASPSTPLFHVMGPTINILALIALLLCVAASRTRSRARMWLVLIAAITSTESMDQLQPHGRFSSTWYVGRLFGMAGFLLLLVVLVLEVLRQSRELIERRDEAQRLAQIVEQSPVGQYLVDNDMRVVDINAAFTSLTGFTRQELVGQALPLVPDPGSTRLAWSLLERLRGKSAESVSMRVQVPRKGQPALWVDWTAHALLDASGVVVGTAGSIVDASDAMAMDLDIQVPVGIALIGRDRRLTHANAALCNLAGRAMAGLMDVSLLNSFLPEDHAAITSMVDDIASGAQPSGRLECRLRRPDGSTLWVVLYGNRLTGMDGGFDGAALQVIDISGRKAAEANAERAEQEIAYRARYDPLTGLLNHQSLVDAIDDAIRGLDAHRQLAVVLLDIDGFQAVSNALTREQGDLVLQELGELIVEHVDAQDRVARVSADEFAFTISADDIDVVKRVQELMIAITNHEFGVHDKHVYLTVSVGVTLGGRGMQGADLLQEADMAMRQAQKLGRGNWQMFTHEYRAEVHSRVELTREIHGALDRKEFQAWYMPIVHMDDRRVDGYEALVRWQSANGLRTPDRFLRLAEETGLIIDIGTQVFDQAVRKLLELPAPLRMSINAAPTQLLRGDVFLHIKALLPETGVAPERLVVEITEQSLFETKKASDASIFQLAELGVGIHVDDFGTGYSSITHIRDFPITGLKLDASFTAGLDAGHRQSIEIAGILGALTHRLNIEGVAEGVETEEQMTKLRELGWSLGQGWLFGRPAPEPQRSSGP